MDTEDRRYFKQQEITLWRKADKSRKSALSSSNNPHVPSHLVGSDGEIMSKHTATTNTTPGAQSTNTSDENNTDSCNDTKVGGRRDLADSDELSPKNEKTVGLFQEESPEHSMYCLRLQFVESRE